MAREKTKCIVIASVLNPVDDTRMFEKLGLTLADKIQLPVHIIGVASQHKESLRQNIFFHALPTLKRFSLKRLFRSLKIFWLIRKLNPTIIIISTHELLVPAIIFNMIHRCKIIYDVRENYYNNILYTAAFAKALRPIVATYVRMKEWCCSYFIDHFIFAERVYTSEIKFHHNRFTVLENKLKRPDFIVKEKHDGRQITLLFTGTLSESTGIFEAISLAKKLHSLDHNILFKILGFAAQPSVLNRIQKEIVQHSFITLQGGDQLIPHQQILHAIAAADFGIIAYPKNKSTENKIPTKLFEYLGLRLPIILIDELNLHTYCLQYGACIAANPAGYDAGEILERMKSDNFYTSNPKDVYWDAEEIKLEAIVQKLL